MGNTPSERDILLIYTRGFVITDKDKILCTDFINTNGIIFQWWYNGFNFFECGRFFMMTSSNRNIFRVTGLLCGEFTGPGDFPTQRPVTRGFDVFFDLRLNKRMSKQSWGWWLETLSCSLWRQSNVISVSPWLRVGWVVKEACSQPASESGFESVQGK